MFQLTYDQNHTTPDGEHSVPDHVTAINEQSCHFAFTTSAVTGAASYAESLSVDASVEGGGWGAKFSASVDYQQVSQTTSNHEDRFYASQAQCVVYSAAIDYGSAKLTDEFKTNVKRLSTNSSDQDTTIQYQNFINQFGTHFVYSMRMGGRYGYRSQISNSNSMGLTMKGLDIKASAGYSGLFSVSASAGTEEQKEQAEAFNTARSYVEKFNVGGGPPGGDNWTEYDWANTVAQFPQPIVYTLLHIENLFIDDYFPDDQDIDTKRDILKEALLKHCRKISIEAGLCDKEYASASTLIPIKILAPENVKPYGDYFVPLLEPNEKAPGIIVGLTHPNSSFIIRANDEKKLVDLVRQAKGWVLSNISGGSDKMPACHEGFRSISDFYPTTYLGNFNKTTLPCFAEKCLTACTMQKMTNKDTYLVYQNGYPALGGYYEKALYSFYRCFARNRPDDNGILGNHKCLLYSCLDF